MAGRRQAQGRPTPPPSAAAQRRAARRAAERRQRLIVGAALGGLVAVVTILLAGLYVTQYRPPRAHALTVGERDYDVSAVARRAQYRALFESGETYPAGEVSLARNAANLLAEEEALRRRAPATVGEVTAEEIDAELRVLLGVGERDAAASDAAPDSDVPFAEALRDMLRLSGLSQQALRDVVAAGLLRERLEQSLRDAEEPAAPQLRLARVRLADATTAEEVWGRAAAGEDFAALVEQHSIDVAHREDGGDLGWFTPALLADGEGEQAAAAVEGLAEGEVAAVVTSGIFFDVYLVGEREQERALDGAQLDRLVDMGLAAWLHEAREAVGVTLDLSPGEETWIAERVVAVLNEAFPQLFAGG